MNRTSLSVVILSYTLDLDIFELNQKCINSLLLSEDWGKYDLNIVLIESNKNACYQYDKRVEILIPPDDFNFHRFLNIGIQHSNSDFVALCNNDIIFGNNWFSEILKISTINKDFLCFSPIDRDYETMSYELFPENKSYYVGWDNKFHYAAWCMVWKRKVFDIIGSLDEEFNFYSADDDELMTMRKYAIKNILVTNSHVKHLSQIVTKKENEINSHKIHDREKFPLSDAQLLRGLSWLWEDERFYDAYFKMEAKWGVERVYKGINRFLDQYSFLRIRILTVILYNRHVNRIIAKLMGL